MTNTAILELSTLLEQLGALLAEEKALTAPYNAEIKRLELERDSATAHLAFQIETLKAVIRPLVLAEGRSVKTQGVSAIVTHKRTWDDSGLQRFAQEVPAVLQFWVDASYVAFRQRR